MNSPEACRKRLLKYVIPVFIFSIIFNITKFMEARLVYCPIRREPDNLTHVLMDDPTTTDAVNPVYYSSDCGMNMTGLEELEPQVSTLLKAAFPRKNDNSLLFQIRATELRKNVNYAIYFNNWARLLVLGIIPAAMLIYFNYKVYTTKKRTNKQVVCAYHLTSSSTCT